MDISINTNALNSGVNSISQIVYRLREYVEFMNGVLIRSADDFTSVNYYRIESSLKDATLAIKRFNNKLECVREYLNKLENIISHYDSCRY